MMYVCAINWETDCVSCSIDMSSIRSEDKDSRSLSSRLVMSVGL